VHQQKFCAHEQEQGDCDCVFQKYSLSMHFTKAER